MKIEQEATERTENNKTAVSNVWSLFALFISCFFYFLC
jgi:hypothetical protein